MENLKNQLGQFGISLKKKYGQNFLTDEVLLEEIVKTAGIEKSDYVLEIGCGAGALTKVLVNNASYVFGYEIDKTLKPLLDEKFAGINNLKISYKDIMKENIKELEKEIGREYFLIANLPYYITTPIVMNFLENSEHLKAMVIMVQEEVADRFSAKAGSSDYGAITVGINLRGSAEKLMRVDRTKFTPVPNVDSAIIKICIDKNKFKDVDLKKVRNVVRSAFSSRRKMLVNNLMNFYKLSRAEAEAKLLKSNIPLTVRGEDLTAEEFVKLSESM